MKNFSSWRLLGPLLSKRHQNGSPTFKRRTVSSICIGLALATGLLAGASSATAAPSITINDISVTEGNSGVQTAIFTVYLSASSATNVSVKYETVNGTATAGTDYNALAQSTLVFAPGQTSKAINVTVKGDVIDEIDETFSLKLSYPTGATIADATGVGKIVDNDTSVISATGASVTEGNSGTTPLDFTLKLSIPNSRVVTVKAKTTDAPTTPATVNNDYLGLSSTVSFAPGETTKTVPVSVKGDVLDDDPKEYVGFALSSPVNAVLGTAGVGTIVDDDATPTISVNDASVQEGNVGTANIFFQVTLSGASSKPVTVQYATAIGTASASDFTELPPTILTFAPGQTAKAVTVAVTNDYVDELDETFALNLTSPTNSTIADKQGVGTIVDNDTSILSITGPGSGVVEGNSGTTPMNFSVKLSNPSSRVVSVRAYAYGTATSGTDFSLPANPYTLYFPVGETSRTLPLNIKGDLLNEPNERIAVSINTPVNAVIANVSLAEGTIIDDDPILNISDKSVQQIFSGTVNVSLYVTLSAPSPNTVTVNYATANGTAEAGSDYVSVPSTPLTFVPGETQKTLTFTVKSEPNQSSPDGDENFKVVLSGVTNALLPDNTGVITIVDNINTAPIANSIFKDAGTVFRDEQVSLTIDISEFATDPNGDPLEITFVNVPEDTGADGSAEIVNNKIHYFTTRHTGAYGPVYDTIQYTVWDGVAESSGEIQVKFTVGY